MERSSRVVLNQRVQPIPKRDRAASGESSVVGEGLAELHFDFLIFSRAISISNFLVYTLHIFSVNIFSALASFVTPGRSEHESNPSTRANQSEYSCFEQPVRLRLSQGYPEHRQ